VKPDQLNAGFEALAALLIWLNVADVWKKKATAGIHWIPLSLFTIWGYWNLFYYPHLGQWWSFAAAGFVAVANSAWLWLVVKYR
jgi:hypothetical protein